MLHHPQVRDKHDASGSTGSSVEFDRLASNYDTLLDDPLRNRFVSRPDFFHRRKWDLIQAFLAASRLDSRAMAWLDVGCGRGELLDIGADHFQLAAGCDPSREMIRHGRGQIHWQPELNKLPLADAKFDFVTAVCVFHHVPAPNRPNLVAEVVRLLRPNGIFCVIEHNPFNPATRWIVSRTPVDRDAHLLSSSLTARILRSQGLAPVETSYFLYAPEKWYERLGGFETLLKRIPAGGQYAVFARKSATPE